MINSLRNISLSGLCVYCGDKPAEIDGRWCSRRCRFHAQRELDTAPTPDEIRERCEEIQATWNNRTRTRGKT